MPPSLFLFGRDAKHQGPGDMIRLFLIRSFPIAFAPSRQITELAHSNSAVSEPNQWPCYKR